MPLSDHEQRLLEQLERQLSSDDPRFASAMRGSRRQGSSAQRWTIGGIAVVVGLLVLVVGVTQQNTTVGIIAGLGGFLVMLGGAIYALSAPRRRGPTGVVGPGGARPNRPRKPQTKSAMMTRLEQRWERRRGNGWGG